MPITVSARRGVAAEGLVVASVRAADAPPHQPHNSQHQKPTSAPVLQRAAMNEVTWRTVMQWEQLHRDECCKPTLLRFMGKPHDLR